jgi:hypothetical protein
MGFRMTVFSVYAQNRTSPTPSSTAFLYKTKRRPRPSPLAIVRERLFLNSESEGPLAIRDMRRFITAGDGLAHQFPGADFRSRFD